MALPHSLGTDTRVLLDAIRKERFAHRRTLQYFEATMRRLATRDATQRLSSKMCVLCTNVPIGLNPDRYRATCPHIHRHRVTLESARLEQRWEDYKSDLLAQIEKELATPYEDKRSEFCPLCREHVTPEHYCVAAQDEADSADA